MIDFIKQILRGQIEAALAMMKQCVEACPPERWEGKIANGTFRQVAYHTLFFVDLYLSPSDEAFELREVHRRGGDKRIGADAGGGLTQDETLAYLAICRRKAVETLAAE